MAHGLAHTSDLAIATFVNGETHYPCIGLGHLGRSGEAIVEFHPFTQTTQRPWCQHPIDMGEVLLVNTETGMG